MASFCGGSAEGLNLNETMMPEYFNSAGYTSQIVGKWHLGFTSWEHTPTFRGFSSFYGFYSCAQVVVRAWRKCKITAAL